MSACLILWSLLAVQLLCANAKQKEILKSSTDLLEKENSRLGESGISCSQSSVTQKKLDSLRLSGKHNHAIACHLKFLEAVENHSKQTHSWAWSSLGQVYMNQGSTKHIGLAKVCFKQALKLGSKVDSFVRQWHFLGPFVIGKAEVDGDPVGALGGIHNVSKARYTKQAVYHSELVPNGELTWKMYKQSKEQERIQIQPQLNWNELINSLGSIAITEWQGWVIGEFAVNDNGNIILQCLGVHTVYIDSAPVVADVYRREQFWFAVQLAKGIHSLSIRLRAKGAQVFQCQMKVAPATYEILKPPYLPDLYDGYLFSGYIYLPFSNYHHSKWLKVTKVTVEEHSATATLNIDRVDDKKFGIAPGQTTSVILRLSAENPKLFDACTDLHLKLKIVTSEEPIVYPLSLRCRQKGESFLFTFLDHDGSVQHAAAIKPLLSLDSDTYPVLLTLHGTTVLAQNQADSYKHMVNGKFVFGLEKAWVLAPTRHGAHNWEGPGALTAIAALGALAALSHEHSWLQAKATEDHVIFAGHSMGGHGAWHLAVHYPDRALAVVSLAGWLKKEEYGDSNLFFRHDIATSHVDPAVKAVMEACTAENEADRHVSNLWGIPVMTRIGANDRTIHPYFARRMHRLLQEWHINVTYVEIPGLEHWWWDTKKTNDGGCVNDQQLRDFTSYFANLAVALESCESEGVGQEQECEAGDVARNRYSRTAGQAEYFTYQLINPAYGEAMRGLQILQQHVPFRMSTVQGEVLEDVVKLKTSNVLRLSLKRSLIRPINWKDKTLQVDQSVFMAEQIAEIDHKQQCLCRVSAAEWEICYDCGTFETKERGPANLGPARRVAEKPFLIVAGTQAGESMSRIIQDYALYIANLFYLTSDTKATVVRDADLTQEEAANYNLIVLGKPSENTFSAQFFDRIPLELTEDDCIRLHSCTFGEPRTGAIFVSPHADNKLALVLVGNSQQGLGDVVSLATPTIPPMTRSPFSNMVPDFVITGSDFGWKGSGGYMCAGFWGNQWQFRPELASCAHCI